MGMAGGRSPAEPEGLDRGWTIGCIPTRVRRIRAKQTGRHDRPRWQRPVSLGPRDPIRAIRVGGDMPIAGVGHQRGGADLTLARELSPNRLESLVDCVLARRGCTPPEIHVVVESSPGMPGVGKLRPIVEFRQPDACQPPSTELERLLYRILDDHVYPRIPGRCQCDTSGLTQLSTPSWPTGI